MKERYFRLPSSDVKVVIFIDDHSFTVWPLDFDGGYSYNNYDMDYWKLSEMKDFGVEIDRRIAKSIGKNIPTIRVLKALIKASAKQ